MESQSTPIKLHIPSATLKELSFCSANGADFSKWAKSLPMANTGEASRRLYQAVREINSLDTSPEDRFEFLEIIRPYIHSVCKVLNKHFLQSSISLNDKQLKIANLTQALQGHLATGYKMVVAHGAKTFKVGERTPKYFAKATHRAISDSGQILLRSFQLYSQSPERAWIDVNQLYLMAEEHLIDGIAIEDQQARYVHKSSIRDAFIRVHLLGTAKPSNLRQQDLAQLYEATEYWCSAASLTSVDDESALFIINLHRDRPGQYRQHIRDAQKASFRSLNTQKLVQALKVHSSSPNEAKVHVPEKTNESLLIHAIQSWGIHWQRSFRRVPTDGGLSVCIGFSALHYFTAGMRDFDQVSLKMKPVLNEHGQIVDTGSSMSDDVWADAFDAGGSRMPDNAGMNLDAIEFITKHQIEVEDEESSQPKTRYNSYKVTLINTSPGGYCLHWEGDVPSAIQAGELIGVQESGVRQWSIGVIRWIRHLRDQGTQLGVELLAPKAEVGIARLLQKTGSNGPQMRALVLPAIKAIAQPATLLLPRIPFRTGNKIELLHDELNGRYQLIKSLASTSSFSQFQFRVAGVTASSKPAISTTGDNLLEDDFDSLWNKL